MRLVGFPDEDIVALIEDAAGGGIRTDPDAPRNAPAISPESYLDKVGWHADFFQYERLIDDVITVNHTSLAGATNTFGVAGHLQVTIGNNTRVTDLTLYTHSLGYKPICFVQYNGIALNSTIVQRDGAGRFRIVSPYATTSVVGIHEVAWASDTALSAASRDYRVAICRNPDADVDQPLLGTVGAHISVGRGKVNTAEQYARILAGGEGNGFKVDLERTLDFRGGARRQVSGGVTDDTGTYTGSFTGGPYVEIGFGT